MNRYQDLYQKFLGMAFIVAPLLLFLGAVTFLLGVGLTSYGVGSWVEGALMACAFLIFVPVYLSLSRMLGERAPSLGIVCAIIGLGIGFGILPATARITQAALDAGGFDVPVFSLQHGGSLPILIWFGLAMLVVPILLGIGFLRFGGIPRWTAVLLICAPILLMIGQNGDETIAWWQVNVLYPLATVFWFLALAPIGLRLLRGSAERVMGEPVRTRGATN